MLSLRHIICAPPFSGLIGGAGVSANNAAISWSASGKVLTAVSCRTGFFSKTQKSSLDLEAATAEEAVTTSGEAQLAKAEPASVTARGPIPIITKRELPYLPVGREPRQAWVENLDTIEEKKLGLVDLHPDVFGTFPRIELMHANIRWQQMYKTVNWAWSPTRGECYGRKGKPWPQKGLGKARHGHRKSPLWLYGAKAHGPRGPKTYFFTLPFYKRIHGLTSSLSVKLAQDDLKIVDNLDIPSEDPNYLENLVAARHWGVSVLFVDDTDIAPRNLAIATDTLGHMNIMPVYGLNVYSMLKHETLVLTIAAVNKLEERLLFHLNRYNDRPPTAGKMHYGLVL